MADEPTPKPKGKGGNFLKGKIAGVPKPVIAIAVGGIAFLGYRWWKNRQSASTSSTATPTASTGTTADTSGGATSPDGSGGYSGSGWQGSGGNNGEDGTSSPTDTSPLTPAPTSTANTSSITPTGAKTITIAGKSYSTVSGFLQNGVQYLGVDNPAEAQRLTAAGVHLVQNPNDPNGKGEFIVIPKGATGPVISKKAPAKKPAPKKKVTAKK